jgi:hypothetical protein
MNKLFLLFISFSWYTSSPGQTNKIQKLWTEGVSAIQNGDYLSGMLAMDSALIFIPFSEDAYYNRGICRMYLGDKAGSCSDLNRSAEKSSFFTKKFIRYYCDTNYISSFLKTYYYKSTKLLAEKGYRPEYTKRDTLRGALRPERNCFDVFYYNLTVRIHLFSHSIEGVNEIWFRGINHSAEIQLDLFRNLTIKSVLLDSVELEYRREFDAFFVKIPNGITPGKDYKIVVAYSGKPREAPNPPWDGGFVWSRDKRLNHWVGVACEQLGASVWWPVKDHLLDKPDSMRLNIEVPSRFQAICNGTLQKVVPIDKKYSRYEWLVHYPINNYNATFYMGKYSEFTDTLYSLGDTLVMRYHVMPYHTQKAKEHFKQAKPVVNSYNKAFGAFPFWKDDFRMVESPFEGMEHQTAIAYGESFDNKRNSRTYLNHQFDYIIVHEAAHEWWGNSVAVGDMADIWLSEGFSTYAEYIFLEDTLGYKVALAELHQNLSNIYNFWPLVQNRDVNENTFASSDVYSKGATLLNCLRATINNDSIFKNLIRDFHKSHRFKMPIQAAIILLFSKNTCTKQACRFWLIPSKRKAPILCSTTIGPKYGMVLKCHFLLSCWAKKIVCV